MKSIPVDSTCETDYFRACQLEEILLFSYKGNSLLASTIIKAKESVFDFLTRVAADSRVRIVVLMHGPRKPRREEYLSFHDMLSSSRLSKNSVMRLYRAVDQLMLHILSSDLFFIAANCGQILPMLIGVSLACDYRILGDNAVIQNPSLEVGLAPKGAVPFFLRQSSGKGRIYDFILSSRDINAQEAVGFGLADRCVPMPTFEEDVLKIARQFAALPASSLRLAKRLINFSVSELESYLEYENRQLLGAMHRAESPRQPK